MGPIEQNLRWACSFWPDLVAVIARAGTDDGCRMLIYGASGTAPRAIGTIISDGDLADVLSEAIEAAEALGL